MPQTDNPWEAAVGRFVLAFGEIEHCTILLLSYLPECRIPETAAKLPLGTRLDLLKEVLSRSDTDPDHSNALVALDAVRKLVTDRNLIAHNALSIHVQQVEEKLVFHTELVSARNKERRLNLREVQILADEAYKCSRLVADVTLDVMRRYGDFEE